MSRRSGAWSTWTVAGLLACSGGPRPQVAPVPELPEGDVAVRLYLIGDAGEPDPRGEPVLQALSRELQSSGSKAVVAFLGDNIYPRGLPEPAHPFRKEAERRLWTQVDAVTSAGGTAYFVPGNHDWAKSGAGGWDSIRRQQAFIDSAGAGAATLLPRDGCPGPSLVSLRRLQLVLLDTQWWLHDGPKPRHPHSECGADSESEVVDSLKALLRSVKDSTVVVVAHHPLSSGGVHGGFFGWTKHVFPLTEVEPWLWIPLPFLGSLYPTARQHGISSQDTESRAYKRLITNLTRAFEDAPPDIYAAGHEHNLQVIAGGAAPLQVVSGAGFYGHSGRSVSIRGTVFAKQASGFARLDVSEQGPSRLAVLEVDREGRTREVFSTLVE